MDTTKEERCKEAFKNHIVTYEQYHKLDKDGGVIDTIESILWAEPGTSNYAIRYIVKGNTLFVTGDLGEAVYQWCDKINFEWLSTLFFGYFAEKCEASEVGRRFSEWSVEEAVSNLRKYAKDDYFKWEDFEELEGTSAIYSEEEWVQWVRDNGEEVFGQDCWEWAYDIGNDRHIRCYCHFIGIKMAVEQLKIKG